MKILALNAGSSSLKAALYSMPDAMESVQTLLWHAKVECREPIEEAQLRALLQPLWTGPEAVLRSLDDVDAVVHRIVHGGSIHESSVLTAQVRAAIAEAKDLAPTHNQAGLDVMRAMDQVAGDRIPQVAVFDTAFHATIAPEVAAYPGPYEWFEQGLRKFGFHGISHQYASERARQMFGGGTAELRLVTCHLGGGCSLAAVKGGKCIDTTMGFTPLDGLMMGTRSGSVDPGLLIYLLRHRGYSTDDLDRVLNRESGLLGISGVSADVREIEASMANGNARAALACRMFVHRIRSYVGMMAASLEGLDALVFTGGIGENRSEIRSSVCAGLEFLGVKLDPARNSGPIGDAEVSPSSGRARVLVVRTQEEWAMARECFHLLTAGRPR